MSEKAKKAKVPRFTAAVRRGIQAIIPFVEVNRFPDSELYYRTGESGDEDIEAALDWLGFIIRDYDGRTGKRKAEK